MLASFGLGTFYNPLKHTLGYLNAPRLLFHHIGLQKPHLPLDIGKLSPMHIRKYAIHSSAFMKCFPYTPEGNLLDIDSARANTVSPSQSAGASADLLLQKAVLLSR